MSQGHELSVSVVIPTHNRVDTLLRTLASLDALERPAGVHMHIVVVANACRDETVPRVRAFAQASRWPIDVVEEPRANLNVARNRGVTASCDPLIAFLDDDVWVERTWLEGLYRAWSEGQADIVGGPVRLWWEAVERPEWMTRRLEGYLTCKDHGQLAMRLWDRCDVVGANFAVGRHVFSQVGLFLEGLDRTAQQMLSAGDNEFVQRALAGGARLYYAPQMAVRHWVAPHRASPVYLGKVARANAESRVYIRPKQSVWRMPRTILGHLYLAAACGVCEFVLRLARRPSWVQYHVGRQTGLGGLLGAWRWLRGRTPVASAPPQLDAQTEPCIKTR